MVFEYFRKKATEWDVCVFICVCGKRKRKKELSMKDN